MGGSFCPTRVCAKGTEEESSGEVGQDIVTNNDQLVEETKGSMGCSYKSSQLLYSLDQTPLLISSFPTHATR